MSNRRLSRTHLDLLRCPRCMGSLGCTEPSARCANADCAAEFPIIDGIPILIDEASSVFSLSDFVGRRGTYFADGGHSALRRTALRLLPSIDRNVRGAANYGKLRQILRASGAAPRVLVLGGSILGDGLEAMAGDPEINLLETDVSFGPRTRLVCDAHDLPFRDQSFDCVIVQAVLEHVVDPHRCVEEIFRVLKDRGIVYAETPFMQQVHGGRYDFTRFTDLGHRRLFRRFEEIDRGCVCGPGMALAWSYRSFLLSFATSRRARAALRAFASCTSFWLKYFDHRLARTPGGLDAASGLYFMGSKSSRTLPDRELLRLYRGAGS